jgi:hypothetical protein
MAVDQEIFLAEKLDKKQQFLCQQLANPFQPSMMSKAIIIPK